MDAKAPKGNNRQTQDHDGGGDDDDGDDTEEESDCDGDDDTQRADFVKQKRYLSGADACMLCASQTQLEQLDPSSDPRATYRFLFR